MTTRTIPPKRTIHPEPPRSHPKPPEAPPVSVKPEPLPTPPPPPSKPPEKPHWQPKDMEQAIMEIYHLIGDRYPVSAGVKQILERNLGKGYARQITSP